MIAQFKDSENAFLFKFHSEGIDDISRISAAHAQIKETSTSYI